MYTDVRDSDDIWNVAQVVKDTPLHADETNIPKWLSNKVRSI